MLEKKHNPHGKIDPLRTILAKEQDKFDLIQPKTGEAEPTLRTRQSPLQQVEMQLLKEGREVSTIYRHAYLPNTKLQQTLLKN